jgi:predicted NAD/FAD-dependent oxidoreductase
LLNLRAAVVGGGMSGVACASHLHAAGADVVLLDRGHRLGGRMATRTMRGTGLPYDGRVVDVGASYLTFITDGFGDRVGDWVARGLAVEWTDRFHIAGADGLVESSPGIVRYSAPLGMRSLVEDLAADLPVVIGPHEVDGIVRVGGGVRDGDKVRDGGGVLVDGERFDVVVLAMPGPQALDLLAAGDPAAAAVGAQVWIPALTLVAAYTERCWDQFDAVFVNDSDELVFIADDGRRRGDLAPVLVAHAAQPLAERYLDQPLEALPELIAALARVTGAGSDPAWSDVRRWSLARVAEPAARTHWYDGSVGLCGDAWSDVSRVEAAYVSGVALADAILAARR